MSSRISTTIGDHCTVTSSKRFHLSERSDYGVPFYCSKEIIQKVNGQEITECDFIREELYEQVKKQILFDNIKLVGLIGKNGIISKSEFQ